MRKRPMPRWPHEPPRGKKNRSANHVRSDEGPHPGVPIDLGIAVSVFSTSPDGKVLELRDGKGTRVTAIVRPAGKAPWPTEQ